MKRFDQIIIIASKIRTRSEELKTRWRMARSIQQAVRSANRISDQFSAESAIEFLYSDLAREIRPWQYREELELLAEEIEKRQPRTILEIGTASGGTLFLASRLTGDDALIISIDLPDGEFGGGYPKWKSPLYHSFKRKNQTMELVRGDSHTAEVLSQVAKYLDGRAVDYLFLDGDHTYEGVKQDFEAYSKFLAPDAFVAFHDIVSDKTNPPNHFVSVFWEEVKQQYPHKEFIRDRTQSKLGLGVLYMSHETHVD